MKKEKAQGAFEYILLLGGVLLIVVLITLVLMSASTGSGGSVTANQNITNLINKCNVTAKYWQQNQTVYCPPYW